MKSKLNKPYIVFFGEGKKVYCFEFKAQSHYLEALVEINKRPGRLIYTLTNFRFDKTSPLVLKARSVISLDNGYSEIIKTTRLDGDVTDLFCRLMDFVNLGEKGDAFDVKETLVDVDELDTEDPMTYVVKLGELWCLGDIRYLATNAIPATVPITVRHFESVLDNLIGKCGECTPPFLSPGMKPSSIKSRVVEIDPDRTAFIIKDVEVKLMGLGADGLNKCAEIRGEILPCGPYGDKLKAVLDSGGVPEFTPRIITGDSSTNVIRPNVMLEGIVTWDLAMDLEQPKS